MSERPTVMSRARFRSTWSDNGPEHYTADDAFNELPIVRHHDQEKDHIDPTAIARDIATLKSLDAVLTHIQTNIAHRMPDRPNAPVPTFGELHAAAEDIGRVFEWYFELLTHRTLLTRTPTEQFNIYEPFRFAWISDPERFDYRRCEAQIDYLRGRQNG